MINSTRHLFLAPVLACGMPPDSVSCLTLLLMNPRKRTSQAISVMTSQRSAQIACMFTHAYGRFHQLCRPIRLAVKLGTKYQSKLPAEEDDANTYGQMTFTCNARPLHTAPCIVPRVSCSHSLPCAHTRVPSNMLTCISSIVICQSVKHGSLFPLESCP